MESYLADCDGMIQHGDSVTEFMQQLPELTLDVAGCKTLLVWLETLPQMQEALRPKMFAELQSGLIAKVKELGDVVSKTSSEVEVINETVKMLTEACISFPLEEGLLDLKESCGVKLGEASTLTKL
eukprot:4317040-Amphidinium_carterae.1